MKIKIPYRIRKIIRLAGNHFARVNPTPIFILGNQKSGTTAIAKLLAYATRSSVALDLGDMLKWIDSINRGEITFSDFVKKNRYDFSKTIVKEPELTLYFDEMNLAFKHSKYVFVIRDPRDNIRSILDRCGIRGNLKEITRSELEQAKGGWDRLLKKNLEDDERTTYITRLAKRWDTFANIYAKNSARFVLIRYEDFNKDKPKAIERLVKALGLEVSRRIEKIMDIQYQPMGASRNVSWSEFYGRNNLLLIEEICGGTMTRIGYKV